MGEQRGRAAGRLAALARRRLTGALPTILLYLTQFLVVLLLFGSEYAMVIAGASVLFEVRRNRYNTAADCLKMFCVSMLLCALALAATRGIALSILLNIAVPFALVCIQSSQFIPKGHFVYTMTFVFLELIPPADGRHALNQFLATGVSTAAAVAALLLYGRWAGRAMAPGRQVGDALRRLARLLRELSEGRDDGEVRDELVRLEQTFQRQGYQRRRLLLPSQRARRRFFNLFALLIQRAVYLLADPGWQDQRDHPACRAALLDLADLSEQAAAAAGPEDREALTARARTLLDREALPRGRVRIFYRSFLHTALLLLRPPGEDLWRAPAPRRRLSWRQAAVLLRRQFSPESFEVRFAVRLAVVLTVSCTVSLAWDFEHTYWFPLHAFLLLQPSYEESARRMVTRPIGTAVGCLVVHLAVPWLPGTAGIFIFSLCMISLMHCCTPGTWIHPVFSTAFALTLATLTVEQGEAISLRLFYLLLAVALVLLVNRFVFPTRRAQQFRRNLRALFRYQARYWETIRRSLREPLHPETAGELLAGCHLVYHEAAEFARQLPPQRAEAYRPVFLILWNMCSELEQILCLIQTRPADGPDRAAPDWDALDRVARRFQAHFDPPRSTPPEFPPEPAAGGELGYVLARYLDNARALADHADLLRASGVA